MTLCGKYFFWRKTFEVFFKPRRSFAETFKFNQRFVFFRDTFSAIINAL
jgi:hypothetical protein